MRSCTQLELTLVRVTERDRGRALTGFAESPRDRGSILQLMRVVCGVGMSCILILGMVHVCSANAVRSIERLAKRRTFRPCLV